MPVDGSDFAALLSDVKGRIHAAQTLANGWSRNTLSLQVEGRAHARHSKTISSLSVEKH